MLRSGMTSVKPKTSTRTMRKIGRSDFKDLLPARRFVGHGALIAQFRAAGPAPRDPSAGRASPRCAVRRGVDCVDDVRLARCSRIMRPMAKKIAKKTKPKKRVSKAVTAAAKKKASAAAARAKKPAPPKKAARKVAKKAARKVAKKAVARPKVPPPKKAKRAAPKRAPASAAKKAAPRTAPKAAPDTFHRRDG